MGGSKREGPCDGRGAEQSRLLVHDDFHRHLAHQPFISAFIRKGLHERAVLELRDELGRDAAADIHPIKGERLQGEVPGFCAIDRRKEIQALAWQSRLVLAIRLGRFLRLDYRP